jgi:hypothetical protein
MAAAAWKSPRFEGAGRLRMSTLVRDSHLFRISAGPPWRERSASINSLGMSSKQSAMHESSALLTIDYGCINSKVARNNFSGGYRIGRSQASDRRASVFAVDNSIRREDLYDRNS